MTPRRRPRELSAAEYRALAEFRYQIRTFLHFSEQQARARELEPAQHQLLLAIQGLPPGERPTVRYLAGRLCIQHHSAVELVNRLARREAVRRRRSEADHREVLVDLTPAGIDLLHGLTVAHRAELGTAGPALARALDGIMRRRKPARRRIA